MYLVKTDEALAKAKALSNSLRESIKVVKAMAYQRSLSAVAAQKEQDALSSQQYREHLDRLREADYDFLLLQTRRETECAIIDCWRSLNAAKNKGMI